MGGDALPLGIGDGLVDDFMGHGRELVLDVHTHGELRILVKLLVHTDDEQLGLLTEGLGDGTLKGLLGIT